MSAVSAADLLAHADAVEHAAALGGYVETGGTRRPLTEAERAAWARDAAVLREAGLALTGGHDDEEQIERFE